jgi:fructose-1,6-bisphosphatase I
MQTGVTFTRFLIEQQRCNPSATGDFSFLVNDIVTAIKEISHLANRGNL